jgi:indole-3-glycerol phosphate synthase
MTKDILTEIIEKKNEYVKKQKTILPQSELKKRLNKTGYIRRLFKETIARPSRINLIAEIKKASPSAGILRRNFDPVVIANIYQDAGVDALSILTEEYFFLGAPGYIKDIRDAVGLPILRKDFIIDDYQIYESYILGADAVLLIAAILSVEQLRSFLNIAEAIGLESLVEVHDEDDLKKALDAKAQIIGINNRNLRTLEVDLMTSQRLIKHIPVYKFTVVESGIKTPEDNRFIKDLGINSVLIGEAFMVAKDIKAKIQELMIY